MESLKVISLFAGAGGMDLGFMAAGFDICVAVEEDPSCCDTLRHNKKKHAPNMEILEGDIRDISSKDILKAANLKPMEAALVIGGPPCQSFSLAGDRKGLEDPRGQLVQEFIRVVRDVLPVGFVMENVKGMLNWSKGQAIELIEKEASQKVVYKGKSYEYTIKHDLLNSANFGAPQFRERVFVVGNRLGRDFKYPVPTHIPAEAVTGGNGVRPYATVGEALNGLGPADPPSAVAQRVSKTIKGRIKRHGY